MVADRTSGDRFAIESIEGLKEHLAPLSMGAAGGVEPRFGSEQPLAGRDQAIALSCSTATRRTSATLAQDRARRCDQRTAAAPPRHNGRRPHPIFAAPGHRRPARPQPLDERGEDRLTVNPGPLSPVRPGWP